MSVNMSADISTVEHNLNKIESLYKELRKKTEPLNCPDSVLLSWSQDDQMRQPWLMNKRRT